MVIGYGSSSHTIPFVPWAPLQTFPSTRIPKKHYGRWKAKKVWNTWWKCKYVHRIPFRLYNNIYSTAWLTVEGIRPLHHAVFYVYIHFYTLRPATNCFVTTVGEIVCAHAIPVHTFWYAECCFVQRHTQNGEPSIWRADTRIPCHRREASPKKSLSFQTMTK